MEPLYRVARRGAEFEKLVRSSSIPDCPSCNGTALKKKLSVFAAAGSIDSAPVAAAPGSCGSCCHAGSQGSCSFH